MAGSYYHIVNEKGQLLSKKDVESMLDSGEDVYQTIEEMYGMIWYFAETLYFESGLKANPREMVDEARLRWSEGVSECSPGRAEGN